MPTPEAAFEAVLETLSERPRSAILAVAGPLEGRRSQLTNASWIFDGPQIARALTLEQGLLVNDFEALAASLAVLRPAMSRRLVAGEPEAEGVAAGARPRHRVRRRRLVERGRARRAGADRGRAYRHRAGGSDRGEALAGAGGGRAARHRREPAQRRRAGAAAPGRGRRQPAWSSPMSAPPTSRRWRSTAIPRR